MKIIIAGAGNVGTHLAKLLSREKQDIILMDDNEEKLSALSANFDLLTVAASPFFHLRIERSRRQRSRPFYRSHTGRKSQHDCLYAGHQPGS